MILQHQWGLIALALLARTAAAQGPNEVTGTAAYRERIALPPDSVFEATLEDVSRAGAAAAVIGRTRLENPGQPPFKFSIQYDPARIEASHTYSVRARINAGGTLMFITDRSYPVLTQGKGNQVAMMIMRRAGTSTGSGPAGPAGPLGTLPASFSGEFPCADCPGIRYSLSLFPDKSFYRRMTYVGRADAKPLDDIGRWALSADGSTLMLSGGKESPDRFAVKGSDVLRKLNVQGGEIESKFDYDLRRTSAFERIEPLWRHRRYPNGLHTRHGDRGRVFQGARQRPLVEDLRTASRVVRCRRRDDRSIRSACPAVDPAARLTLAV